MSVVSIGRLSALLGLPLLGACGVAMPGSSDYTCGEVPAGVCASARDVYRMTDNRTGPMLQTDHAAPDNSAPGGISAQPLPAPRPVGASAPGPASPAAASPALPVSFSQDGAVPLRTPSLVMRVWVAPWETEKGDLVMPGYVYTELAERRWMVGHTAVPTSTVLRPLEPPRGGDSFGAPMQSMPPALTPLPEPRGMDPDMREARTSSGDDGGFFGPRPPVQAASTTGRRPAAQPRNQ